MSVEISCTNCGKTLRAPDEKIGKQALCPSCKTVLTISPQSEDSTAAKPPPRKAAAPKWFVQSYDGNQYGPITKNELDDWVSDAKLTAECQVLRDGDQQWQWAHQLYPQLSQASTSGDCAFDGHTYDPNKLKTLPPISLSKNQQGLVELRRRILEKEVRKHGGQVTNAVGIPTESRSSGWLSQVTVKLNFLTIYDKGSKLHPDFFVVMDVAHASGDFFVVSPWDHAWEAPHQFVAIEPGYLPHSIVFERGDKALSKGAWASNYANDTVCTSAGKNRELTKGMSWDWKMRMSDDDVTVKIQWALQAVPLGKTHYVLMIRTGMRGLVPKHGMEWFLERRQAFANFVAACGGVQSDSEARFLYTTDAIIPLIGKLGEAITAGYQFQK